MFWKLLVAMGGLLVIGAALLGLRSERQAMRREMTQMHERIDDARQRTWDAQVRISERTEPDKLRQALERAGLELEPIAPTRVRESQTPPRHRRMVEARHPEADYDQR